ncbi:glycoside hydrolase family 1 protein [Candidatus Saccharibacteria bacterium]|nr:glycoside hydrolase family 1 protein [Candidatus Saccharibacteria bacterium]
MDKPAKTKKPNIREIMGEDFMWGASTAGHQVEGGNYDQWTVWELAHAKELAETAADRLRWLPGWLNIKDQAEDPDNYVAGKGVDHIHHYKEDFAILKKLNMNAFRFGIEWSRVEPDMGVWDKTALDHYHNYLDELKKLGMEPIVNLWHWTMPVWFAESGGFSKRNNIARFVRFAKKIAEEFGDEITYVLTINEPNVYCSFSYMSGEWPPQEKNIVKALWTYGNLAKAHREVYKVMKNLKPHLQIGVASQFGNGQPKRPGHWLDSRVARLADYGWNWWFINRIRHCQDFVGFNYYFTNYYQGMKIVNPQTPLNDLGWYMEPGGLAEVIIKTWLRYRKPIMITENGVADQKDAQRQWWLEETFEALITARKAGADVIGYLHWSLLDNFEWKYGWWPKFGLIKVDRERGMKRVVRPSAVWLSEQLKLDADER